MDHALEGQEITRLCLDHSVVLQTADGAELRFETEFSLLCSADAVASAIDPAALAGSGAAVVGLLHRRVELVTSDEGTIALVFSDGRRLECKPSSEFEAWSVTTAAGERWVCLPGGEVAHWQPSQP
jgi:hypothetical protein